MGGLSNYTYIVVWICTYKPNPFYPFVLVHDHVDNICPMYSHVIQLWSACRWDFSFTPPYGLSALIFSCSNNNDDDVDVDNIYFSYWLFFLF